MQIIAVNKGDIPGRIDYKVEDTIFGGKLEVTPHSRYLNPEECGGFLVTFTSNKNGEFLEKLTFIIAESEEPVTFVLTGKVVNPVLHFDKRGINFETVPFGKIIYDRLSMRILNIQYCIRLM